MFDWHPIIHQLTTPIPWTGGDMVRVVEKVLVRMRYRVTKRPIRPGTCVYVSMQVFVSIWVHLHEAHAHLLNVDYKRQPREDDEQHRGEEKVSDKLVRLPEENHLQSGVAVGLVKFEGLKLY